jgi:multicomponent Na+:H+ antiporter subunit C
MVAYLPYILCTVLFMIGVYAIVSKKNLVKIIVGTVIVEYGVNLMLILVGYKRGGLAPILTETVRGTENLVDPLPQALVVTSIVIGLGILALVVSVAIRLHEKYGTFDISEIRRLKG